MRSGFLIYEISLHVYVGKWLISMPLLWSHLMMVLIIWRNLSRLLFWLGSLNSVFLCYSKLDSYAWSKLYVQICRGKMSPSWIHCTTMNSCWIPFTTFTRMNQHRMIATSKYNTLNTEWWFVITQHSDPRRQQCVSAVVLIREQTNVRGLHVIVIW